MKYRSDVYSAIILQNSKECNGSNQYEYDQWRILIPTWMLISKVLLVRGAYLAKEILIEMDVLVKDYYSKM